MKTTLDIADPLLNEARKLAAREGTTLRALVEQGLRQVIADKKRKTAFRLRISRDGGCGRNWWGGMGTSARRRL
jgi:hypothetical protein